MESHSDSAVMRLLQAGDATQLGTLFERYHVPLFRYLLQLSRNRALSEDLVQEVFFRVLKYAQSYDPNFSFTAWLYSMARNAWFDASHKRRGEVPSDAMEQMMSPHPIPEEALSRREEVTHLREALRNLPDAQREVLVLSRFHILRYDDIARILHCEIGTVKVRVYRAMKALRERFCEVRGEAV